MSPSIGTVHAWYIERGPPDLWYRGGEIKIKKKEERASMKPAQSMLCYFLGCL